MDTLKNKLWPECLQVLTAVQQNTIFSELLPDFQRLLEKEKITAETKIMSRFNDLYLPFSGWLAKQHTNHPIVVGINGAQGSGKSTLTKILAMLLEKGFDKRVVTLSLDDLYKTHQQRQHMAETIHPLFITRGVPGTHDVDLGVELLIALKNTQNKDKILLPGFNKATDDQYDRKSWNSIDTPFDIILFEGWCVGAIAEDENALSTAINHLEAKEDPDHSWRQYVNEQLAGPYQTLFAHIDFLIMLEIPHMKHVYQWRSLQEQKLKTSISETDQHIMSSDQIERFIMHFERITRATLKEMPARADIVLKLNEDHQVAKVSTGIPKSKSAIE
jgi:D-glycerate 3-kinase